MKSAKSVYDENRNPLYRGRPALASWAVEASYYDQTQYQEAMGTSRGVGYGMGDTTDVVGTKTRTLWT